MELGFSATEESQTNGGADSGGESRPGRGQLVPPTLAVPMQRERGLQAAEACVLYRASEVADSFFDSLNRNDAVGGARASSPLTAYEGQQRWASQRFSPHRLVTFASARQNAPAPAAAGLSGRDARAPTASFRLNGEWWDAFGLFGTVAAGGRFCGLKAALRSPSLHGYGSAATMQSERGRPTRSQRPHGVMAGLS